MADPSSVGCAGGGNLRFYTVTNVAKRLDVAPRSVRRWIAQGDLKVHRIGRVVRISEDDLLVFLSEHRQ